MNYLGFSEVNLAVVEVTDYFELTTVKVVKIVQWLTLTQYNIIVAELLLL